MNTLPGMPLAPGDIHVCTNIGDGAAVIPRPRRVPAAERVPAPVLDWIVANSCGACNARTGRYCDRHDVLWAFR